VKRDEARRAIEALRYGIPPDGYITEFTVGRAEEISILTETLDGPEHGVLLVQGNYGAGKSHLLRLVREEALEAGYVVSLVSLDAKAFVRFDLMDHILGAIFRSLEVPGKPGQKGIAPFFDMVCSEIEEKKVSMRYSGFWRQLTNDWKWDQSDALDSLAMYVALRAWATGRPNARQIVEDWLYNPWNYASKKASRELHEKLIENLRVYFRDGRILETYLKFGYLAFDCNGYNQTWSALRDIHILAQNSGCKGLVLLFDEFEDVIYNLSRINQQELAFENLFRFYSRRSFQSKSFYGVTPGFVEKCKALLMRKRGFDCDFSRFDDLPTFQLAPIDEDGLTELAVRIRATHEVAFDWSGDSDEIDGELERVVSRWAGMAVEDRVRNAIKETVKALDALLEEAD